MVIAGGLSKLNKTFDSIDECDEFIFKQKTNYIGKSYLNRICSTEQLVLQEYSKLYTAKIVKIYN